MKSLHTCIRVMDLDKSLEFYQNALGYKITKRLDYPDEQFTLVYLALDENDYEIELTYNYDREVPYEMGNGYSHFAIGTNDLDKMHEKMKKQGRKVTDLMGLSDGAARFFFITDPDGYDIEVIQM